MLPRCPIIEGSRFSANFSDILSIIALRVIILETATATTTTIDDRFTVTKLARILSLQRYQIIYRVCQGSWPLRSKNACQQSVKRMPGNTNSRPETKNHLEMGSGLRFFGDFLLEVDRAK
jgi:hypothetical protein